jgi:hypothetical protein
MYLLTIDGDRNVIHTSAHADAAGARRELARWADRADCELCPIQMHADFSSWDVVAVEDNRSRGAATIEALAPVSSAPHAPPSGAPSDTTGVHAGSARMPQSHRARAAHQLGRAS